MSLNLKNYLRGYIYATSFRLDYEGVPTYHCSCKEMMIKAIFTQVKPVGSVYMLLSNKVSDSIFDIWNSYKLPPIQIKKQEEYSCHQILELEAEQEIFQNPIYLDIFLHFARRLGDGKPVDDLEIYQFLLSKVDKLNLLPEYLIVNSEMYKYNGAISNAQKIYDYFEKNP